MQFLSMFNLQPVTAIVQRFSPVAENLGISEIACAVRAAGAGIVCRVGPAGGLACRHDCPGWRGWHGFWLHRSPARMAAYCRSPSNWPPIVLAEKNGLPGRMRGCALQPSKHCAGSNW